MVDSLIQCRFLDKEGNPRGPEYAYKTNVEVSPGDYVMVDVSMGKATTARKKVIVTKANIKPEEIPGYEKFKDVIKNIVGLADDKISPTPEAMENMIPPILSMADL